ncbi:MAG: hypothetical protein HN413_18200 [Chloroflexi bacterium]|jgi:hypothetical protein|nr:hypothetical protein [Chloroflexota bacterium]
MKQDRALLGILGVIIILVIVSLALFFLRGGELEYGPEDTPEGVVRNYVLALHKEDYERAYGYLQSEDHKPTLAEFRQDIISAAWELDNNGLQIGAVDIQENEAVVRLTITHGGTAPFESTWNESNDAWLSLQAGAWKLTYMPYPYWGWGWYQETE